MVHLHADKCVSQKKINYYLTWLGSINKSYLIFGHQILSQLVLWSSEAEVCPIRFGCLADLKQIVNISAVANIAQLVCTQSEEQCCQVCG